MLCWSSPPNWSASALAEHLDGVLPYGGGTRLDRPMRRSPAWPKPGAWAMPKGIRWVVLYAPTLSREGATQTILSGSRRSLLCKNKTSRCSCRTVPATRRTPETLTVLNSSANGAKPFFRWRLRRLRCYWWFYKSFSAFVRCLRSKTRWCSKREAHLIFVY